MYKKELTVKVTTKTDFTVTVNDPVQGKAVADQLGAAKTLHFKSENEYIIPFSSVKEAEVTSTTQEYDDPEDTLCVADPEPTPTPGGWAQTDVVVPSDDQLVFETTGSDFTAADFQTGVIIDWFDEGETITGGLVTGTSKNIDTDSAIPTGHYIVLQLADGVTPATYEGVAQSWELNAGYRAFNVDTSLNIELLKDGVADPLVIDVSGIELEVPSCELEASDIVPADGDTVVYADGGTQYTASQLQSDIVIDADTYQVSGTVYPAINGNYYIAVTKDPTITPMDEVLYGVDDHILVQTANGESLNFYKECASGAITIELGTSGLTFES